MRFEELRDASQSASRQAAKYDASHEVLAHACAHSMHCKNEGVCRHAIYACMERPGAMKQVPKRHWLTCSTLLLPKGISCCRDPKRLCRMQSLAGHRFSPAPGQRQLEGLSSMDTWRFVDVNKRNFRGVLDGFGMR